jgi:hypothetical protein
MNGKHCDELNQILDHPGSTIEKFGILTIVIILVMITIIVLNTRHIDTMDVESISLVKKEKQVLIKASMNDSEMIPEVISIDNILINDFKIKCSLYLSDYNLDTKQYEILLKPDYNIDIGEITTILQSPSELSLKVTYTISYFEIIVKPIFNLINKNN